MKVRCESCGKKFDYEQNDGLCPHCSVYNSPPEQAAEQERQEWRQDVGRQKKAAAALWRDYHRKQDEADNPAKYSNVASEQSAPAEPARQPYQYKGGASGQSVPAGSARRPYQYKGNISGQSASADSPRQPYQYEGMASQTAPGLDTANTRRRRVWPVALLALALGWGAAVGGVWLHQQQWMKYQTLKAQPQTVQLAPGESFAGEVCTIEAQSADVVLPAYSQPLPEGWMLISVQLRVAMSDQEWEDQALTEPYVRLEDGRCLRPVDSYSLGQDTGSLAEQSFYEDLRDQELWDLLYMYTGEEKEGLLYYLVPEDTASLTFCAENRTSQDGQLQSVGEWKLDVEVNAP